MILKMKELCLSLVLSSVVFFIDHTKGARILGMFPQHERSHFIMFEEVMKGLADAGHQVDVVSHYPQKKPYANYTDMINLAGTIPKLMNNMSYETIDTFSNLLSLKEAVDTLGNEVCNLFELPELQQLIKSPPKDPPYDLVLAEFFLSSCFFAFGRHLNVPVVALGSLPPLFHTSEAFGNPTNTAIVAQLDCLTTHMNFWKRLKNTLTVFFVSIRVRYLLKVQNDIVKKHFGPEMPDIDQLERELSLYLVNSHPIFHGVRPMTPAVVEVAGLHVRNDETPIPIELQKWLDDSNDGFIYFSLGSMMKIESFPKAALAEIYSAFSEVAPIRILMKAASPKELPPGLPDNVLTLTWVPQVQVLKHKNIRGFLTHGGLMGLQEAVTFAVPLIGIPLFGDQPGNIQICVERGIAVSLNHKNLKKDEIVAAINAVAHDPKYKNNMNELSKQFLDRPLNARDTAVFWIEYILRHGGDGLRSPAVYLTWWQLSLLDVYGTIIAAVLIVLYLLKLLISAIIGRIYLLHKQSVISIQKGKLKSKKK